MKRIYLVGKSRDNKKLQLAQGKGARFGSMELPISPKLRALLREVEAERLAKRGKKLPDEELKDQRARAREAQAEARKARDGLEGVGKRAQEAEQRAREAEQRATQAGKRAEEAERRATEAEKRATQAEKRAEGAEKRATEAAARVRQQAEAAEERAAKGGLAPGGFERATGVGGMEGIRAIIRPAPDGTGISLPAPQSEPSRPKKPAAAREAAKEKAAEAPTPRRKAEPMPEPKLSAAEIQTLLRSGRGVRSVAKQAEAPVDWVRRLAAPIEAERLGVVSQLLQSYVVRARLGRSALPIGPSIIENLRDRGVRFPERVAEDGWTAWRSDNREWRVRFAYESRGRKQRADWRFEPQSRSVAPQNDLAQELAFRAPVEGDGSGGGAPAPPRKKSASSKRRTSSRNSAGKGSTAKRAGRKRSAGR